MENSKMRRTKDKTTITCNFNLCFLCIADIICDGFD